MNDLNKLAKQFNKYTHEKGFWENPKENGTMLMLMVGELAEACEADRKNHHADTSYIDRMIEEGYTWEDSELSFKTAFERDIKDSFEDELADAIIRILDFVGEKNIDIEKHMELKMAYNKTRPYKHGKNY